VENDFDQFRGSVDYVTSEALRKAVNVAIALERPLLIRGEPGTGKTLLAHSIARGLDKKLTTWNIKSTTKAQDGLYVYDTVQRLNDSRFGDRDVSDIKRYIKQGKLGQAFTSPEQVVLLIDEIDKADIEFPNDLLNELDVMSFHVTETNETVCAIHRPITVITSNAEKELPDAFLRRREAQRAFYALREIDEFRKKPSTSELIDWIQALILGGVNQEAISKELPFIGTLLKKETDYDYFVRNYGGGRINNLFIRRG
jgi:MoxR-like ATPase